jgi:hypothetical protein
MEFVVEVNGENAEVQMWEVEVGGCDEGFGCGGVAKCVEGWFVIWGIGGKLHTFSTPIHKGRVMWGVLNDGCSFHFRDEGKEWGGGFVTGR